MCVRASVSLLPVSLCVCHVFVLLMCVSFSFSLHLCFLSLCSLAPSLSLSVSFSLSSPFLSFSLFSLYRSLSSSLSLLSLTLSPTLIPPLSPLHFSLSLPHSYLSALSSLTSPSLNIVVLGLGVRVYSYALTISWSRLRRNSWWTLPAPLLR